MLICVVLADGTHLTLHDVGMPNIGIGKVRGSSERIANNAVRQQPARVWARCQVGLWLPFSRTVSSHICTSILHFTHYSHSLQTISTVTRYSHSLYLINQSLTTVTHYSHSLQHSVTVSPYHYSQRQSTTVVHLLKLSSSNQLKLHW